MILQPLEAYRFLGEEFLTWLWYMAEEHAGLFRMHDGREVGATLDRYLEFRDDLNDTRLSVRSMAATRTVEASAALRSGKRLTKAHVLLGEGERVYEMTLDAATFDIGALKPPPPIAGEARDEDATLDDLSGAGELLDQLFQQYLETRLSPEWPSEVLPDMRRWAKQHGGAQPPPTARPAPRRKEADSGAGSGADAPF